MAVMFSGWEDNLAKRSQLIAGFIAGFMTMSPAG